MKKGDKVKVIATDKELSAIQMNNKKVNDNLRKYESEITDELKNASFGEDKCKVFVLSSTFTMPEIYLKLVSEIDKKESVKEVKIQAQLTQSEEIQPE